MDPIGPYDRLDLLSWAAGAGTTLTFEAGDVVLNDGVETHRLKCAELDRHPAFAILAAHRRQRQARGELDDLLDLLDDTAQPAAVPTAVVGNLQAILRETAEMVRRADGLLQQAPVPIGQVAATADQLAGRARTLRKVAAEAARTYTTTLNAVYAAARKAELEAEIAELNSQLDAIPGYEPGVTSYGTFRQIIADCR